jgi:hypothetical protein
MYHCVAAVDEIMEHLREWAVGELEITLFDRKNFESQKRVFGLAAVTAQLASGCRDEHFGVLGHASLLPKALGEGEEKSRDGTHHVS